MIGKLSGIVDSITEDHAILDVVGVGYLVHCPALTLSRFTVGSHVALHIETRFTDETIKLYGFFTPKEREWFRLLQTVQNVGARVALSVLSTLSPSELERALALSDKTMVARSPGVGPKLALRIVTELKDKAPAMILHSHAGEALPAAMAPRGPEADAVAALVKLGYSEGQAVQAVVRAAQNLGGNVDSGALSHEALRMMGR